MEIPIYAKENGEMEVSIQSDGKEAVVLQSFQVSVNKGLNFIPYDLTVKGEQLSVYKELLNKKVKKGQKPVSVKLADNGKLYLKSGQYKLQIKQGANSLVKKFELK